MSVSVCGYPYSTNRLLRYPSKHVDRIDYEVSTGNLRRHAQCCDPDETPATEMITTYAHGVTYTPARLHLLLALWCSRRHRPYAIVEDPEIQEILRMLYSKVHIPSRYTVSRDVKVLHREMQLALIELLAVSSLSFRRSTVFLVELYLHSLFQSLPCRLHICVDGWTSPNVLSFLGITVHWHWDGEIRHVILDFIRYDHRGLPSIRCTLGYLPSTFQSHKCAYWGVPRRKGGGMLEGIRNTRQSTYLLGDVLVLSIDLNLAGARSHL